MMKKRILAFAAAAITAVSLAVSASAEELAVSVENQEFMDLADGDTSNLQRAGEPPVSFVEGKGLFITDRVNGWDSLDFKFANLEDGKNYRIEVEFDSDTATEFVIAIADAPYGDYIKGGKSLSYEFSLDEVKATGEGGQDRMRLNAVDSSEGSLDSFYVKSIKVYDLSAAAPATEDVADDSTTDTAEAPAAGDTATVTADKASADTGIEGVAVIAAVALVAAGGIVIARKKK